MKWKKFTIQTTTAAEDFISEKLSEIGIEGIEIEDKVELTANDTKGMFIDVLPDLGPDDGEALVSFYLDDTYDVPKTLAAVKMALEEVASFVNAGSCEITASETEDKDWMNNWKKFWKPFKVDDKIIIKPTWEKLPEDTTEDTLVVELDPGTAFGTGMHHTTRLCITQMKKYLKEGQKLFDVGCGSGILSIIGLMLGAGEAMATDVDPNAVSAAIENARVNHINMNQYDVKAGDIITDVDFRHACGDEKYDLVLANILADVIIPLSGVIKDNMKPGALFVSSGIINTKEDDVREALLANGFEILEVTHSGDWVAFTARK
jgi:ribosomal protein L11 methyltransferase